MAAGLTEKEKRLGKRCYVCNMRSHYPGPFCEDCYQMNAGHRENKTDLTGKVCIVTGCRVKIGYQTALALLRMGATVVGTTRFPADALRRFRAEEDGEVIVARLRIHRVELLCMGDITRFTNAILEEYKDLHVIVNNAAQTIKRPPDFYKHLLPAEQVGHAESTNTTKGTFQPARLTDATNVEYAEEEEEEEMGGERASHGPEIPGVRQRDEALPVGRQDERRGDGRDVKRDEGREVELGTPRDVSLPDHFPEGQLDEDGQQVDLRKENSWTQEMGQVNPVELVECLFMNAAAPFILVQNLLPLLRVTRGSKFVVNASAMEGKFNRYKTHYHPHTNMAKAALNQWVRTSGSQLAKMNIYMTAVDTGWVTDERPFCHRESAPYDIPLDSKDGAMRLLHPVIAGYSGGHLYHSIFLKDYKYTSW